MSEKSKSGETLSQDKDGVIRKLHTERSMCCEAETQKIVSRQRWRYTKAEGAIWFREE